MALDIGSLLGGHIGPVPTWAVVVGGGAALAIFAPKLLSKFTSSGSSSAQGGPTDNTGTPGITNNLPDTIDPITGIPYAVEEAIDPNTGLPAYFTLYQQGGGIGMPPNPNPTPPPTNPTPPAAPLPQSPATVDAGTAAATTTTAQSTGAAFAPPSAGPGVGVGASGVPVASPYGRTPTPGASPYGRTPTPASGQAPPGASPSRQVGTPPGASPYPRRFVSPRPWPQRDSTLSQIASDNGVTLARLQAFPENAYIGQRLGGWNHIVTSDRIRVA